MMGFGGAGGIKILIIRNEKHCKIKYLALGPLLPV